MKSAESLNIETQVRENYLLMSSGDLSKLVGRSESWVKQFKRDNGLIVPAATSRRWTAEKNAKRTSCTPEDDKFLQENYLLHGSKALARLIGFSETKVLTRMRQLNLVVPEEVKAKRVLNNRFKLGDVPVTKGKKQTDYMTPDAIERTKATRFKAGSLPSNTKGEFGMVTTRTNYKKGTKAKYICIRIGLWEPLHKYNWEKEFGPIPDGRRLRFKDKDTLNCEVENLELIAKKQKKILRNKEPRKAKALSMVADNQLNSKIKGKKLLLDDKKNARKLSKARIAERKLQDKIERWEDSLILKFHKQAFKISTRLNKPAKVKVIIVKPDSQLQQKQQNELKLAAKAKEKTLAAFKKEQDKLSYKRAKESSRIAKEAEKTKVMPTRIIDESALVRLRIDSKTEIYIKPDADPEVIKKRFADRHKNVRSFYD